MEQMLFKKLRDVKSPTRGTSQSAGIDFFIPEDWNDHKPFVLGPNEDVLIPSGLKVKLPEGTALIAFNKSGIATKRKLIVGACVVDEDYQGEVHIHLINTSKNGITLAPGDKVAQFIILHVNYAEPKEIGIDEYLYDAVSERGEGGFGSTDHAPHSGNIHDETDAINH